MKISFTITAALLGATTALTIPSQSPDTLSARAFTPQNGDPEMVPVTVEDLASDATMTCGSTTFSYDDIYKAVQWGDLLQDAGLGRGKKSKQYPNGRFPHTYDSTQYTFNGDCPADANRQEYPLIADGPYNGGISNNVQWGNHRVVYYREPGQIGTDGHDLVYFCGGVTHEGAPTSSDFLQCTVN